MRRMPLAINLSDDEQSVTTESAFILEIRRCYLLMKKHKCVSKKKETSVSSLDGTANAPLKTANAPLERQLWRRWCSLLFFLVLL